MGKPQEYLQTDLDTWARSDQYHNQHLIGADQVLDHVLETSASLPNIAVSKAQGKFLYLLVKSLQAKRVLEVGTLGGQVVHWPSQLVELDLLNDPRPFSYSTIWLARGLPDTGRLTTLEINPRHAAIALDNFTYAGLGGKIQLILGPATESLERLQPDPQFDLIFIDADKQGNLDYFIQAKRLVREGGVIIGTVSHSTPAINGHSDRIVPVDNVVRYGRVADPNYNDDAVQGVRRLVEYLKTDNTVDATTLSTVGEKGYDGFIYAVKL